MSALCALPAHVPGFARQARLNASILGVSLNLCAAIRQSMPVSFRVSSCTTLPLRLACRTLQAIRPQLLSSITSRRFQSEGLQICSIATMPPKQATLGYVRSSQTTLGCEEATNCMLHRSLHIDKHTTGSSLARTAPPRSSNRSCLSRPKRSPRRKTQRKQKNLSRR